MATQTTTQYYHVQALLSETAKAALRCEQGRRLQQGKKVPIKDIVSEWLEERAKQEV